MWQAHKTITFNKQLEFKRNLQKNLLSTFAVLEEVLIWNLSVLLQLLDV